MPIIKDRLLPYMRSKLIYFLKDFFVLYTLAALFFKSVIFIGFISSSNPSKFNLHRGFDLVYYPLYTFSFILIFLSFGYIFKGRKRAWFLFFINAFLTVVFLGDLWYFRAFGSFISPYLLSQTANLENLSDSLFSMMSRWDCVLLIDLLIPPVILLRFKNFNRDRKRHLAAFAILFVLSTGFVLYVPFKVNVLGKSDGMSFIYKVPWKPEFSVYCLSPAGYHLFDVFVYFKDSRRLSLKPDEAAEIKTWFKNKNETCLIISIKPC
jgi:phosphoglycerol transferase MdoB-like AlkP superfamily enzyme